MRLKENEIINELKNQEDLLQPLGVSRIDPQPSWTDNYQIDAIIEFSIQNGPSFEAAVEILSIATPKAIAQKSKILVNFATEFKNKKLIPMIIAPYISQKESKLLLKAGISWIDLSGNMLIKISPNIYVERTGKPNKFPDTAPIKKIYEGTSSLVGRALLLNPDGFSSLYKIADFINDRNATITIATISKVLKSLEEELIVSKDKSKIRVKKPEALLENLTAGYSDYLKRKKDRKYKYDIERINQLSTVLFNAQVDYAYCGFYAAKLKGLGITEQVTVFVKSIQDIKKAFRLNPDMAKPDEEYGQVTFIEANNPCVWFNMKEEPFNNIVDDLELYLEMANDKPRGPKIATQLKERILGKFNR